MRLSLQTLVTLLMMLFIVGCPDTIVDAALTDDEVAKIARLQNPFEKPLITLSAEGDESEATFGIRDCRVYKANIVEGVIIAWELVIKPDFSLLPQVCDRESMRIEAGYLLVDTGLISFGAGGCCSAMGKYRTKDGIDWERHVKGQWKKIDKADASKTELLSE